MRRAMIIKHNDGSPDTELELSKAVSVDTGKADFIYFDKLANGTWRITASKAIIDDFSKIDCFKIHREPI
jgi:hypothetical protein